MKLEKLKVLREELMPKYAMRIEPLEPIITADDFKKELIRYCETERKELVILKEGMLPIVSIDNKTFIARLDRFFGILRPGSKVDTPYPIPYFGGSLGYKWVYLYPYKYNVNNSK